MPGVAIVAGVSLCFCRQHQQLSALRTEIAAKKATLAGVGQDTPTQREEGKSRNRSGRVSGEGLTADGEADLPEARELLAKVAELSRGRTTQEYAAMDRAPELSRLRWLFAGMGGKTFLKLMEGREAVCLSNVPEEDIFRKMFKEMNPQQSLELVLASPPDEWRDDDIGGNFMLWSELAPDAALAWFHKKEAEGDSLAQGGELQTWVMKAEVGTHPARVVDRLLNPGNSRGRPVSLTTVFDGVREPVERVAFLAAIDAARQEGSHEHEAVTLRETFIKSIVMDLSQQPFAEASKVVDGAYTSAEKLNFADFLSRSLDSKVSGDDWKKWSQWMAGLDAPVDQNHPLVKLMFNSSNFGGRRASWIADVPPGALRDLAVSKYVVSFASPEAAVDLIRLLPEGQERRSLAGAVRSRAAKANPGAVESLRKLEDLEAPAESR